MDVTLCLLYFLNNENPHLLKELHKCADNGNVGKSHTLANKECALSKDAVEDSQDTGNVLLGLVIGSLVELNNAESGVDPDARGGVDLVVGHIDKLLDQSLLVLVLGSEALVKAGDW